jgi:hypothetical protein
VFLLHVKSDRFFLEFDQDEASAMIQIHDTNKG